MNQDRYAWQQFEDDPLNKEKNKIKEARGIGQQPSPTSPDINAPNYQPNPITPSQGVSPTPQPSSQDSWTGNFFDMYEQEASAPPPTTPPPIATQEPTGNFFDMYEQQPDSFGGDTPTPVGQTTPPPQDQSWISQNIINPFMAGAEQGLETAGHTTLAGMEAMSMAGGAEGLSSLFDEWGRDFDSWVQADNPSVPQDDRIENVKDIGSGIRWIARALGNTTSSLPTMIGGMLGSALPVIGAKVGAYAPAYVMAVGDIYDTILEEIPDMDREVASRYAMSGAVPYAMMDAIGGATKGLRAMKQKWKKDYVQVVIKEAIKNGWVKSGTDVLKYVGKEGLLEEGLPEALQGVVTDATVSIANDEDMEAYGKRLQKNAMNYVNEGFSGAVGGAGSGVVSRGASMAMNATGIQTQAQQRAMAQDKMQAKEDLTAHDEEFNRVANAVDKMNLRVQQAGTDVEFLEILNEIQALEDSGEINEPQKKAMLKFVQGKLNALKAGKPDEKTMATSVKGREYGTQEEAGVIKNLGDATGVEDDIAKADAELDRSNVQAPTGSLDNQVRDAQGSAVNPTVSSERQAIANQSNEVINNTLRQQGLLDETQEDTATNQQTNVPSSEMPNIDQQDQAEMPTEATGMAQDGRSPAGEGSQPEEGDVRTEPISLGETVYDQNGGAFEVKAIQPNGAVVGQGLDGKRKRLAPEEFTREVNDIDQQPAQKKATNPESWNREDVRVAGGEEEVASRAQQTQRGKATEPTYEKIGKLPSYDGSKKTLNYGAGDLLGHRHLGQNAESYEPFPPAGATPDHTETDGIADGSIDQLVSNAVLNVVPRQTRDEIVKDWKRLVAPNGKIFVGVRSRSSVLESKSARDASNEYGVPDDGGVIVKSQDGGENYQKGFLAKELKDYLLTELGDDFEVVGNFGGGLQLILQRKSNESREDIRPSHPQAPKIDKRGGGKYPVGKKMGNQNYVHKQYVQDMPYSKAVQKAEQSLPKGFDYQVVKYDNKTGDVSFIKSADFDTATEPHIDGFFNVKPDGKVNQKNYSKGKRPIYHHKWQMVDDNYSGFDVNESKGRSKFWADEVGKGREQTPEYKGTVYDQNRYGQESVWNEMPFNKAETEVSENTAEGEIGVESVTENAYIEGEDSYTDEEGVGREDVATDEDGRDRIHRVSAETIVGKSTRVLEKIIQAPLDVRQEFHADMQTAMTNPETNKLHVLEEMGIDHEVSNHISGYINSDGELETNPTMVIRIPKGIKLEEAEQVAKMMGLYAFQEGVGGYAPSEVAEDTPNTLSINIGREFSEDELRGVFGAINGYIDGASGDVAPFPTENGIDLVHLGFNPDVDFEKLSGVIFEHLKQGIDAGVFDTDATMGDFHSKTLYVTNDWKEYPNGENYTQRGGSDLDAGGEGRSDLLKRLDDRLRDPIQAIYEKWAGRGYGLTPREAGVSTGSDTDVRNSALSDEDIREDIANEMKDPVIRNDKAYEIPIDPKSRKNVFEKIDKWLRDFPELVRDSWQEATGLIRKTSAVKPPTRLQGIIQNAQNWYDNERVNYRGLAKAKAGLKEAEDTRNLWLSGKVPPALGEKVIFHAVLWNILSRGVSPSPQENMYHFALKNGVDQFFSLGKEGWGVNEQEAFQEWVESQVKPDAKGFPAMSTSHNMGGFNRNTLGFLNHTIKTGDPDYEFEGETVSFALYRAMSETDPTTGQPYTGRDIRRHWQRWRETPNGLIKAGIGNKVISFLLLSQGFTDVLIFDRQLINGLWDAENLAPKLGIKTKKKDAETDDLYMNAHMDALFEGVRGLAFYEAMEDAVLKHIVPVYQQNGEIGSISRFHWELWNQLATQDADHRTLAIIARLLRGEPLNTAILGLGSREGKYNWDYGWQTGLVSDEKGSSKFIYIYEHPKTGVRYVFTKDEKAKAKRLLTNKKTGVVREGFKVEGGFPFTEDESYDINRHSSIIESVGRRADERENAILDRTSLQPIKNNVRYDITVEDSYTNDPVSDAEAKENFSRWFKNSVVRDEDGNPLVVYHGTMNNFSVFNPNGGNIETYLGSGIYITSSSADASNNYASKDAPDLQGKIGRASDNFYDDPDAMRELAIGYFEENPVEVDGKYADPYEMSDDTLDDLIDQYRDAIIGSTIHEGKANVMPVYLSIQSPFNLQTTELTAEMDLDVGAYMEDAQEQVDNDDFYEGFTVEQKEEAVKQLAEEMALENTYGDEISGSLVDFLEAFKDVASEFDGNEDLGAFVSEITEEGLDYGGMNAGELVEKIKETIQYLYDPDTGDYAVGQAIREAVERAGYDGIVMDAGIAFGRRFGFGGAPRAGMDHVGGTTHYIAFNANQVKSATGNSGRYSEESNDIREDMNGLGGKAIRTDNRDTPKKVLNERKMIIEALGKQLVDGGITEEEYAQHMSTMRFASVEYTEGDYSGAENIEERLNEMVALGQIAPDAVGIWKYFVDQNPALVDDLMVAFSEQGDSRAGSYISIPSVMNIVKDPQGRRLKTIVHETLHHLEKMMPQDMRKYIYDLMMQREADAIKNAHIELSRQPQLLIEANKTKNEKTILTAQRNAERAGDLVQVLHDMRILRETNDPVVKKRIRDTIVKWDTAFKEQAYQFTHPSEFWAENASRILADRYEAKKSIVKRIRQWLREANQKLRGVAGKTSDTALFDILEKMSQGVGLVQTNRLLEQSDMNAYLEESENVRPNQGGAPSIREEIQAGKTLRRRSFRRDGEAVSFHSKEAQREAKEIIASKDPKKNHALFLAKQLHPNFSPSFEEQTDPKLQKRVAKTFEALESAHVPHEETELERKIYNDWKKRLEAGGYNFEELGIKNYKDLVDASYAEFGKESAEQYEATLNDGMIFEWDSDGSKGYPNSRAMVTDVLLNNHEFVFQGGDPHPALSSPDKDGLSLNDKFRAIHDYYGHATSGAEFGARGEQNAWFNHSQMFSPLARLAMATETKGQNSWVNFSGENEEALSYFAEASDLRAQARKAKGEAKRNLTRLAQDASRLGAEKFQFAQQKSVVLPYEALKEGFSDIDTREDITGYHGGRKGIDRFSTDKIGSGEGQTRYGRGIYFSGENMKFRAEHYKDFIGKKEGEEGQGYTVNLTPSPEDFMDWDLPVADQSPRVQKAMKAIAKKHLSDKSYYTYVGAGREEDTRVLIDGELNPNMRGADFYRALSLDEVSGEDTHDGQGRFATNALLEGGISGNKYRGLGHGKIQDHWYQKKDVGDYDYVMFTDKGIDITDRWDIAVSDTPEFKKFIKGSHVTNEDGSPMVVYHKTDGDFDVFDSEMIGKNDGGYAGRGFYFTPEPLGGMTYGKATMPVYLSIKNPYIRTKENWNTDKLNPYEWIPANAERLGGQTEASVAWTQMMKEKGYDGFIDKAVDGGEIVAFDPTQIKSATGNNGNFDATNPDIREDIYGMHESELVRANSTSKVLALLKKVNSSSIRGLLSKDGLHIADAYDWTHEEMKEALGIPEGEPAVYLYIKPDDNGRLVTTHFEAKPNADDIKYLKDLGLQWQRWRDAQELFSRNDDGNQNREDIAVTDTPEFKNFIEGSQETDILYHGTQTPTFVEFDTGATSQNSRNTTDITSLLGAHFSKSQAVASRFAEGLYGESDEGGAVYPVYVNTKKPYPSNSRGKDAYDSDFELLIKNRDNLYRKAVQARPDLETLQKALQDGNFEEALKTEYDQEIGKIEKQISDLLLEARNDQAFMSEADLREEMLQFAKDNNMLRDTDQNLHMISPSEKSRIAKAFKEHLQSQGYDSIRYKNAVESEGYGTETYIVFNPAQIKSATGNNGNFDPNNPDIREDVSGEFWLQDGTAHSADGDVDDANHEGMVMESLRYEASEILGVDPDEWDYVAGDFIDEATEKKLIDGGMTEDKVKALQGLVDARDIGMEDYGWVRLQSNNIQTHSLDNNQLRAIGDGLWDAYQEDAENETYNIEVYGSGKYYTGVPWSVIASNKVANLRDYDYEVSGNREDISPESGFYSQLRRTIDQKMGRAMPVQDLIKMIEKDQQVKKDEFIYTGLRDYLEGYSEPTISKEDVQTFLDINEFDIEVTTHSSDGRPTWNDYDGDYASITLQKGNKKTHVWSLERVASGFVLRTRGGQDDVFRTDDIEEAKRLVEERYSHLFKIDTTIHRRLQLEGSKEDSYKEILLRLPQSARIGEYNAPSAHWSDNEQVVGHIRFGEHMDTDGDRVMFIEEMQSDWHHAGRDGGYQNNEGVASIEQKITDLENELWEVLSDEQKAVARSPRNVFDGDTRLWLKNQNRNNPEIFSKITEFEKLRMDRSKLRTGVGDAPFKGIKDWGELLFKHALKFAVDNDMDKIAWITGEQSADRYNLRKFINAVEFKQEQTHIQIPKGELTDEQYEAILSYYKREGMAGDAYRKFWNRDRMEQSLSEGLPIKAFRDKVGEKFSLFEDYVSGDLRVTAHGENGIVSNDYFENEKDLQAFYGNEIGSKIWEQKNGIIEGVDLETGGEFHDQLYNKTFPSMIGKYAKKLDKDHEGVKVIKRVTNPKYTNEDLRDSGVEELTSLMVSDEVSEQLAIDITPRLREAVGEGQARFDIDPDEEARAFPQSLEASGREATQENYRRVTNKADLEFARNRLASNGIYNTFKELYPDDIEDREKMSMGSKDFATALLLMDQFAIEKQMATDEGNNEVAQEFSDKQLQLGLHVSRKLTQAGQFIQSASIVSKLDAGAVRMAVERKIESINKTRKEFHSEAPEFSVSDADKDKIERIAGEARELGFLSDDALAVSDVMQKISETIPLTQADIKVLKDFKSKIESMLPKAPKKDSKAKVPEWRSTLEAMTKSQAEKARERLRLRGRIRSGIDPQELADWSIIGAEKALTTGLKFADWANDMREEYDFLTNDELKEIFKSVRGNTSENEKVARRIHRASKPLLDFIGTLEEKKDTFSLIDPSRATQLEKEVSDLKKLTGQAQVERAMELQASFDMMAEPTWGDKISTYQVISHLFNTVTMSRNILGNEMFYRLERLRKYPATIMDIATSVSGGKRSVTFKKANQAGYWDAFFRGSRMAWKGVAPAELDTRFSLSAKGFAFKSKYNPLHWAEKSLSVALRGFDYASYSRAYNQTLGELAEVAWLNSDRSGNKEKFLQSFMENADDIALQTAHDYGKYVTFQSDGMVSEIFSGTKNLLNRPSRFIPSGKLEGRFEGFGLGDIVMKYAKTPANLLQTALDYSPAGFIRDAVNLGRLVGGSEKYDQREFVEGLSRSITGTFGVTMFGMVLAELGLLSGDEDDWDKDTFEGQYGGMGAYRVNVSGILRFVNPLAKGGIFNKENAKPQDGDTIYSYDWMQPIAISLAMGASIVEDLNKVEYGSEQRGNIETAGKALVSGAKTILQQPLISGLVDLSRVLNPRGNASVNAVTRILEGIPPQLIPSAVYQITKMLDNDRRITSAPTSGERILNKIGARIPFLSKRLPASYKELGIDEEKLRYLDGNEWYKVMFSVGFSSAYGMNQNAMKIMNAYEQSGDKRVFPRTDTYSLDFGASTLNDAFRREIFAKNKQLRASGKEVIPFEKRMSISLSGEDVSQMQRLIGKYTLANIDRLNLENRSPERQVELVTDAVNDGYAEAREWFIKNRLKSYVDYKLLPTKER